MRFKLLIATLFLLSMGIIPQAVRAQECSATCSDDLDYCLETCSSVDCESACEDIWQSCDDACVAAEEEAAAEAEFATSDTSAEDASSSESTTDEDASSSDSTSTEEASSSDPETTEFTSSSDPTESTTTEDFYASDTTEAVATSDTIEYIAVDQTTYFKELQDNGITFAYVSNTCQTTGECTLEDIMQVFTNIANFIIGIVGSLTLLFFVYGGFLWLTSQGSSEAIQKGKTAMTGSVVGMMIVFGAFTAINLLTSSLRGGESGQTNKCELVSVAEGGQAGTGYACIETKGLSVSLSGTTASTTTTTGTDYSCIADLCPRPANNESILCCIKN